MSMLSLLKNYNPKPDPDRAIKRYAGSLYIENNRRTSLTSSPVGNCWIAPYYNGLQLLIIKDKIITKTAILKITDLDCDKSIRDKLLTLSDILKEGEYVLLNLTTLSKYRSDVVTIRCYGLNADREQLSLRRIAPRYLADLHLVIVGVRGDTVNSLAARYYDKYQVKLNTLKWELVSPNNFTDRLSIPLNDLSVIRHDLGVNPNDTTDIGVITYTQGLGYYYGQVRDY